MAEAYRLAVASGKARRRLRLEAWRCSVTVPDSPGMTSWSARLCALVLALGTLFAACTRGNESEPIVTLVTHSSPGGCSDVFLREMVPHLSRIMGTTFVVQNLQGGSGARAIAALAGARPDGRMFYATTPTFVYTSLLSRPAAR